VSGLQKSEIASVRVWLAWLAATVFACAVLWSLPINNDVSYQYWVGRQLRGGASFGRDIAELNPPLWFWEAALLSAVSDGLRIASDHIVVVSVVARSILAAALCVALIDDMPVARRIAAGAGLVLLLLILPIRDYGERDHLMIPGALPYAALIARRRCGQAIAPGLIIAVGSLAAYAFLLKPHFAIVPLFLEIWLIAGLGRRWRSIRIETVLIASMTALYAAAIAIRAPAYVTEMIPLARQAYGAFGASLSDLVLAQPYAPVWAILTLFFATRWQKLSPAARAATILGLACATSYATQAKGFSYHALPVTISLVWALWLTLCEGRAIAPGVLRVAALAVLAATTAMALMIGPYRADDLGTISKRLRQLPAGSTFAAISAHSWDAFPLVEQQRFVWPFRAASLWTLPAIVSRGDAPHSILIDDPERAPDMAGRRFDYRAFIQQEPRVAAMLKTYRATAKHGRMTLLETTSPWPPRTVGCRAVAIRPAFD
jgi:hypothetical protein